MHMKITTQLSWKIIIHLAQYKVVCCFYESEDMKPNALHSSNDLSKWNFPYTYFIIPQNL